MPSKSMSSKSQASPTPSASESFWVGLDTPGQLSQRDPTLSPSIMQVPPPHTADVEQGSPGVGPPEQMPSSWPGLYSNGQLSAAGTMWSLSMSLKESSPAVPSPSPSHSGSR